NTEPDLWQQRSRMPGGTSRATVPVLLAEANDLGGGQAGGPAAVTAGTRSSATSGLTIAVISFMGVRLPWTTPTARLRRGAAPGPARAEGQPGEVQQSRRDRHAAPDSKRVKPRWIRRGQETYIGG